jgi:hypothetical protein
MKKSTYYYENIPLRDYCNLNNINYNTIMSRIRILKSVNKETPDNLIIEEAINSFNDRRCQYTYNGLSLKKYCEINNYNYNKIYRKIKNLSEEEATKEIELYIKSNPSKQKRKVKINGLFLKNYCEKYNYKYSTVKFYLKRIKKSTTTLTELQCIKKALLNYQINDIYKSKYFYNNEDIHTFCRRRKLNYLNFISILKNIEIKDTYNISSEELTNILKLYKEKELNTIFSNLSTTKKDTIKRVLHIDISNINYSKREEYILKNWFLENNSSLSKLLGYYKLHLEDTRELLINELSYLEDKNINKLIMQYNIKDNNYINELYSYTRYLMYELIETNNYNEDNLIIDYFDRNIYLYLSNKINKDKTFSSSLVEGKKPKKVTNLVNTNPVIINSYLEDKILSLEILNQQVIIYLYIFNYSYEDVSNILNLSISEIKKIEKLSLKYLKEIIASEKINLVVSK